MGAILVAIGLAAPVQAQDGLPGAASGALKGKLERGPDGRLRVVPPTADEASPEATDEGPLHPPGASVTIRQSVTWAHNQLRSVGGYDHGKRAQDLQGRIDRVVARERLRKGPGKDTALGELTANERRLVADLRARDRAVRRHEMRHYEMGRPYTRLPRYWFVTGPDRRRYAVSGSVSFALEKLSGKPHELLHQMTVLRRAALAPREPSQQDLEVARSLGEIIQRLRDRAALSK